MRRANDRDYNMLRGILQNQGPDAAMSRINQFRNQINPRDLKAAEMAVKQFAKGGMVGAEASYKANGGWVGNYAYGGATPESHPGKPVGTDTVPAWLTEGEFVVDRDSAQQFRPELEKINAWEPTSGAAGREARQSDMINQQAQYKQLGGIIKNIPDLPPAFGNILKGIGGGGGGNYAQAREAALKAKLASQKGSLLAGGAEGSGIAQQNQAGLITQAGQDNQAFTPQAGAGAAVAQGVKGAQEAEALYQGDLANIARQEYEDQVAAEQEQYDRDRQQQQDFEKQAGPIRKQIKEIEEGNEAFEESIREAGVMDGYVVAAGPAWKVFADNVSVENLTGADNAFTRWWQGGGGTNETIQLAYLTQKALSKVQDGVGTDYNQSQANSVAQAVAALDNLATAALKAQGPGVKTNFDFQVARQTITNLATNAAQVQAGIKAFIERAQRAIETNNKKIQELTEELDGLAAGFGFEPADQ